MKNRWKKLGRLYTPEGRCRHPKLNSHAALPLPVLLDGDVYRIFFSGRDSQNRSSVGAVDIDIVRRRIVTEHREPFFEHGPAGSFYADGVSVGNCYQSGGSRYMLFMAWQSPPGKHWRGDIGRLIVNTDLTLRLDDDAPFMTTDAFDLISLSYPWVLEEKSRFLMWYGSTSSWDAGNGEMVHLINFATSSDGLSWTRHGLAVPYEIGVAQAFSRPTVVRKADIGFDMWFSYRSGTGQSYRIGYASSRDGRNWQLDLGNAGIDVSTEGWDSEMVEYPYVFDHAGERYMLYNGNGYGRSGFGLAAWSGA
jgi:hypothetical protein